MGQVLKKMLAAFHTKKLELVLVGLENSGKTTLMNVLAYGHAVDTCPTVGLNVKVVRKGGVMLKCWDVGGQQHYRSEWGRYTRGCDVIIYVVDAYAQDRVSSAKKELHRLLEDRELAKTPLLVLANKIDLKPHMSEHDLIKEMNLDYIVDNPWIVIPMSALHTTNIDQVLTWLVKQAKSQPVE
nr:Arl18 [Vischeria sp. CAUP Q 202]